MWTGCVAVPVDTGCPMNLFWFKDLISSFRYCPNCPTGFTGCSFLLIYLSIFVWSCYRISVIYFWIVQSLFFSYFHLCWSQWLVWPDMGQKVKPKIKLHELFCLQTHHKTIDTNEKVIFQGFILALTKIHFYHLPPQN